MKTVMIIGAAGMIGVYLTDDLIENGYKVIAVCHKESDVNAYKKRGIESYLLDISNKENFKTLPASGIDSVVLLAGILPAGMKGYFPEKYFEINTIGTLNVLEYCRTTGIKQILFTQSHSDVSGHWAEEIIDPYAPYAINYNNDHTVYVISKIAAAELLKNYHEMYGISYAVFRCPNIYSFHPDKYYYVDGKQKVVAYRMFIDKAIAGEPIEIWGNSQMKRDVVYVKDLTQLIRLSIEKEITHGVYNVSNGVELTLEQQVKDTIEVFSEKDKKSPIIYKPEINIPEIKYHYDISNAVKDLGYKPKYFHLEMLKDMKEEMKNNRFEFLNKMVTGGVQPYSIITKYLYRPSPFFAISA